MRSQLSTHTAPLSPSLQYGTAYTMRDAGETPLATHTLGTRPPQQPWQPSVAATTAARRPPSSSSSSASVTRDVHSVAASTPRHRVGTVDSVDGWHEATHKAAELATLSAAALYGSTHSHTLAGMTNASTHRTSSSPASCALSIMQYTVPSLSFAVASEPQRGDEGTRCSAHGSMHARTGGGDIYNDDNDDDDDDDVSDRHRTPPRPASYLLHADALDDFGTTRMGNASPPPSLPLTQRSHSRPTPRVVTAAAAAAAATTTAAATSAALMRHAVPPLSVTAPLAALACLRDDSGATERTTAVCAYLDSCPGGNGAEGGEDASGHAQQRRTPAQSDSYHSQLSPGSPPRVVHTARVTPVYAGANALPVFTASRATGTLTQDDATPSTLTNTTGNSVHTIPMLSSPTRSTHPTAPADMDAYEACQLYSCHTDDKLIAAAAAAAAATTTTTTTTTMDATWRLRAMLRYTCPSLALPPSPAAVAPRTTETAASRDDAGRMAGEAVVACGSAATVLRRVRRQQQQQQQPQRLAQRHACNGTTPLAQWAARAATAATPTLYARVHACDTLSGQSLARYVFPSRPPPQPLTRESQAHAPPPPPPSLPSSPPRCVVRVYSAKAAAVVVLSCSDDKEHVAPGTPARRLSRGVHACARSNDAAQTRCARRAAALAAVHAMLS